MEEDINTGVIYKMTNTNNNKIYIGKAFSYEKHGKRKPSKYGGIGRLRRHISNANSTDKKINSECPLLYEAIRKDGKDCWEVDTLLVCKKKDLKSNETEQIKKHKSYLPDIGYNFLMGDNKPKDGNNKDEYEKKKISSNRKRAKNSAMKRTEVSKKLPTNIYYRKSKLSGKEVEGYFVQIKINGKYKSKAFMSKKLTMDEKLEKAKEFLANLKKEHKIS